MRVLLVLCMSSASLVCACPAETILAAPAHHEPVGDSWRMVDRATDAPVEVLDPLAGVSMTADLIAGGFWFADGPIWTGASLLFVDIPAGLFYALRRDGVTVVRWGENHGANAFAFDAANAFFACEGMWRRVTVRSRPGAPPRPIAWTYAGKPFNQPNDLTVRRDGNVYFTDPNYGPFANLQDEEAVYRIDPRGKVTRLVADFDQPNGIALSPDQSTLYVVDNGAGELWSAPVRADGSVDQFTWLATTPLGDGMAVDQAGNLYVSDQYGVDVFDPNGRKRGTITLAATPSNCAFGAPDLRTLYITANAYPPPNADSGLYAIRLNVPGLR